MIYERFESNIDWKRTIWFLLLILALAGFFRFYHLGHGLSHHPDERHIIMVAEGLSLKDPNPHSFAYGSFPFYFLWIVSSALSYFIPYLGSYEGLFYVGRSISAIFGLGTVCLSFLVARALYGGRVVPLLAAAFLGFNVFHIQLSRFYAFDGVLAAFNTAALLGMIWIAKTASWRSFLFAGVMLGLSLGTKISSLSLAIPFLVTIVLRLVSEQKYFDKKLFAQIISTGILAVVVFLLVEPYAVLDYETFRNHTNEQISMAKGEWTPPYTIQYEGTPPYIYPLKQIIRYTMGWPLGIACILSTVFILARQTKRLRSEELIPLSWILAVFLVIGSYKVKYPRYYITLYPMLMVFAAYGIFTLSRWLRELKPKVLQYLPAAFVLVWIFVYAVAFMRIYRNEHVYGIASRWIYQNVASNSGILGVDWDDRLPLHLPGEDPGRFRTLGAQWDLNLYDPDLDVPSKVPTLSEKLANADYLILPTQRHPGSIPRLPLKYPYSTNFYRLMFADALGYKLVQTFKVRPGIGAFEYNDDLADESFSVYDHPKVSVFQNIEKLDSKEIAARILNPEPHNPLQTIEAILLRDAGSQKIYDTNTRRAVLIEVILWLVVVEVLGLSVLPLVCLALPKVRGSGIALSKGIGLLLIGYISWLAAFLGIARINAITLWSITFVLILFSSILARKTWGGWRQFFQKYKREILISQGIFLGSFILLLAIRAFHAEIFWGEKPMDFSFLNYFIRMEELPPQDPWASNEKMDYYYFGAYLFSLLHKLSGVYSGVGYNLSIVTVHALFLLSLYGVFVALSRTTWFPILGAFIVSCISNIEVLKLKFVDGKDFNFDLFWASTRLFKSPAITEYPIWSFLFSDLHAHYIALPFSVTVLALGVRFLKKEERFFSASVLAHRVLYAVSMGSLFLMNTWDFLSFAAITVGFLFFRPIRRGFRRFRLRVLWFGATRFFSDLVAIFLLILIVVAPFAMLSGEKARLGYGFVTGIEFNSFSQPLRHLGHWLILILLGFLTLLRFRGRTKKPTIPVVQPLHVQSSPHDFSSEMFNVDVGSVAERQWLEASMPQLIQAPTQVISSEHTSRKVSRLIRICFSLLVFLIPIGFGLLSQLNGIKDLPWSILTLSAFLGGLSVFLSWKKEALAPLRMFGVCGVASATLIAFSELFFLMDRMNTLFKFYNAIWIFLGVQAVIASRYAFIKLWHAKRFLIVKRIIFALFCALPMLCLLGTGANMAIMTAHQKVEGPKPTLDGTVYLAVKDAEEFALIEWLNKNVSGTPTLLEAHGNSYGEFTRIAMHTGIPTVLGWDYHVTQRGVLEPKVRERASDIKHIYTTKSAEIALTLLRKHKVNLIVVGKLERTTYPPSGISKFDERPELFRLLFRKGDTSLYGLSRE